MAIDTIKSTAVLDGTIATADIADDAVTSAKLDTNIAVAGDLTVDTNTLKVDATNNRVGIGTATPSVELDIQTTTSGTKFQIQNTGSGGQNVDIIDDIAQSRIRHVGTRLELGADHNNLGTSDPRVRFRVGNIPQASITGHGGIAFGFGSDTAAANTLNDYEEGTWTPTLTDYSNNAYTTGSGTYGNYIKVGRQVYITARVNPTNKASASGELRVGGLPFTGILQGRNGGIFSFADFGVPSGYDFIYLAQDGSSSIIYLRKHASGGSYNLTDTDIGTLDFGFSLTIIAA